MTYKTKIKDSVKYNKDVLDEDNKEDNSNHTPKVNGLTLKDNKINDNNTEHQRMQNILEEQRDNKFNTIDWTKDTSEEKTENKYDRIDWKTEASEEKKETKWDKIDWNKRDDKADRINDNAKNGLNTDVYSTLDYIEDLRNEVGKLIPNNEKPKGKLSYDNLSLFIGTNKRYIRDVKTNLLNEGYPFYNPNFQFSNKQLETFLDSLSKRFGKEKLESVRRITMKYKDTNDLIDYRPQQWHIHNPDLKYDFFKTLDNPKSGYYFGLLLADGTSDNEKNIGLGLEKSDIKVIERFKKDLQISNKIEHRIDERFIKTTGEFPEQVSVRVGCKPMMGDLKKLGFFDFKSGKALKDGFFTELSDRVKFSILLGFYDGDGERGSSKIISSNKKFLEQIKREFNIRHDVRLGTKGKKNEFVAYKNCKTKNRWYLSLGADIFNKMMESYENSMERKRKYYPMTTHKYSYIKLKETIKNKEILEELLYIAPRTKLAENFSICFETLKKLCDEWNIKALPPSHWKKTENKNWKHEFIDKLRVFKNKYSIDIL
ncbi:MAG: hypothetical protein ACFFHD_14245 [Promethearchaeota archaeon]